jgi:hypothetical protein
MRDWIVSVSREGGGAQRHVAVTTEAGRERLELVLNEGIDETVVQLLRGDFCNHALHTDRLNMDQLIITMNKLLTAS